MYVYAWFIVLTQCLLTVRLAVSEIKPVQTDRQTDRIVNYSNSRCACARWLSISMACKDVEHCSLTPRLSLCIHVLIYMYMYMMSSTRESLTYMYTDYMYLGTPITSLKEMCRFLLPWSIISSYKDHVITRHLWLYVTQSGP